jgi:predicted enzyme related to lactoylglutathione lyase
LKEETGMPSNFVWYELMTTDAKAAEGFYGKVVGWKTQAADQPGMSYTLLLTGDVPTAGLMTLDKEACDAGAKPTWVGYIGVGDVDAAVGRVIKAGGKVHVPPTDIPNIGRFAMVTDPQGAAFNLFKPVSDMPRPPADPATPGLVGWHELMAADANKAFAFYADLFGWTKDEAIDMGAMGHYQLFAAGGPAIGGMMTKPAEVPAPFWGYYFQVDAIGAALERLKAAGGKVINGPMEVPGGSWIVQAIDPQGAMFSLVSRKA